MWRRTKSPGHRGCWAASIIDQIKARARLASSCVDADAQGCWRMVAGGWATPRAIRCVDSRNSKSRRYKNTPLVVQQAGHWRSWRFKQGWVCASTTEYDTTSRLGTCEQFLTQMTPAGVCGNRAGSSQQKATLIRYDFPGPCDYRNLLPS